MSVFSMLRREGDKPTCRRSPISTIVFTRLGHRDGNIFKCLGEQRKNVHSGLRPEVAPRHRHANERRSARLNRSVEDPNRRKKDVKSLIRSYVTCSSKRQSEIEEEWYTADRANRRQLARTKEAYLSEDENNQEVIRNLGPRNVGQTGKKTYPNLGYAKKPTRSQQESDTSKSRRRFACQLMSKHMTGRGIRRTT
ncbi:hypothetical protein Tco_1005688 [Tanacetum coccineum]|uniref:Uncharacterized protein n=1 Tax=Tanacetum coccineum TaxID=301880 RepID=A0ABQ5FFL2_9ASTR